MNKPIATPLSDPDIGPVDADGQEHWPADFARDMAEVHRDPAYWAAIDEALASADRGEAHSHEEMLAMSAAARRRWYAERGLPVPADAAA